MNWINRWGFGGEAGQEKKEMERKQNSSCLPGYHAKGIFILFFDWVIKRTIAVFLKTTE